MTERILARTCEHVRAGHPDKLCDQIADAIIDECLMLTREGAPDSAGRPSERFGLEVLAKGHLVFLTGEMRLSADLWARVDVAGIVRGIWSDLGYPGADDLVVLDHIQEQQPELQASSDRRGAGDQGIMIGYATAETPELMPREYVLARDICIELDRITAAREIDWIRPDGKAQVTISADGSIENIVIGVQHAKVVADLSDSARIQDYIRDFVTMKVLPSVVGEQVPPAVVTVNGTGSFAIGGTVGDAGVLGRKTVVDAYGPRIPIGGGAFSGKDPTKVDRSAAYMARHIARAAVHEGVAGAREATVHIAYAIGGLQPVMVTGQTQDGRDLSCWIKETFPDLSPVSIAERFDLWRRASGADWTYRDSARYGHFGRSGFPWEG